MAATFVGARDSSVSAELTWSVTWSRAGVIVAMVSLLVAGRTLARLPIPLPPVIAIALAASFYNVILALLTWRATQQTEAAADRTRAWVLYVGGFLDTIALALLVLFTGGLLSPWLYFFLATSIASSAILPPTPARVLTVVNAVTALGVVTLPLFRALPAQLSLLQPNFWSQPGYVAVVGISLVGLMVLTAYVVRVPVESARAAAQFQEGMAQIAATLQRAEAGVEQVLSAVCVHAHHWFGVDRAAIALSQGEELVVRAAEGHDAAALLGRRIPMRQVQSLDVEVLRRRSGFYVNYLQRSPFATAPSLTEPGDQAVLVAPLLGTLGVLGVLSLVDRRRPGRFTLTMLQRASILAAQAGVGVENARLLERVREEAESVTALLRASERLTRSDDLPTLLTDLNRIAAEMAGCDRSITFVWDAQREVFHFGSTFGSPSALAEGLRQFEFSRGAFPLLDRLLAGETLVLTPTLAATALPAELQQAFRIGTSAFVPLKTDSQLQGLMTVSYLDPIRDFSAEQLWMLRGIARHAALVIERTHLIAHERAAASTARTLVALAGELSATLDRDRVLSRIPQMAAEAAGCDFALLGLWARDTGKVRVAGVHGFSPDEARELLETALDVTAVPMTEARLHDGLLEVPSPQALPDLPAAFMARWGIGSVLSVSLGPVEERVGSLTIGHRKRSGPFSAAQRQLLEGIARQATVALENARLVEELRNANRLKSDFLSTVSHELRTPLNAIIGYTELLREGALGPLRSEQLEAAEVVANNGEQLLELINATLDLTRLEAGQADVQPSTFSLSELLAEVHGELAARVPPAVRFTWVASPELPLLTTDRAKLKTIVKNLTHNALKFTASGCVEIRAQAAPAPDHVQIVVQDTGIGIAAEDVRAIFEMFRQLEPALTRHFRGVGLGLYIVRRLLQLVHGEIHIHSEPEQGSIFTVILPVQLR